MRRMVLLACLPLAWAATPAAAAAGKDVPWVGFDPMVAEALHALRQSDSSFGDAITLNMDGARVGRDTPDGPSMNFDPTRHLSWIVADMNRDGSPEVFLLLNWQPASGNQVPAGVVMQRIGMRWRIACEFRNEIRQAARGGAVSGQLRLLDRREHGWRRFRVWSGSYGWRPAPDGRAAMDCVRRGA